MFPNEMKPKRDRRPDQDKTLISEYISTVNSIIVDYWTDTQYEDLDQYRISTARFWLLTVTDDTLYAILTRF